VVPVAAIRTADVRKLLERITGRGVHEGETYLLAHAVATDLPGTHLVRLYLHVGVLGDIP